jgi:transglutaminase-like putative cysteine protease
MLTSLAVPASGPIGRLPTARAATLRLSGAALSRETLASQRQSVLSLTGTVAQIRVQVDPWTEAAPLAPEPSANLAPYVTATPFIQCHDRRMIEKAREIVAGATNRQDAARAIYEWVYTKVTKEPTVSLPSALDVLLRPEGDCNEHTYLFVGLARAARLPAKIRVGLTLHKGMFYYHAWPSVYVGRWVDVDPTLGQLGVAADHISLFEGELPEQMKLMGVLGRLKVEVLAVEE